jgi:hypothetical protein
MRDYHQTLETLRNVAGRTAVTSPPAQATRGSGRGAPSPADRPGGGRTTATHRAHLRQRRRPETRAEQRARRAMERGAPVRSSAVHELASAPARYRQVATRGESTPTRVSPTLITSVILVVLVGLLAYGLTLRHSPATPKAGSPTPPPSAASGASTPAASPRQGHAGAGHSPNATNTQRSRKGHGTSATTTMPNIQPTTATAAEAAYAAPTSTYTVQLSASGPCWISATQTSTGRVLWQGTMQAGQTQQIPAAGSVFLRLGAAFDVSVSLNGDPVVLPTGHGSPFSVSFEAT